MFAIKLNTNRSFRKWCNTKYAHFFIYFDIISNKIVFFLFVFPLRCFPLWSSSNLRASSKNVTYDDIEKLLTRREARRNDCKTALAEKLRCHHLVLN